MADPAPIKKYETLAERQVRYQAEDKEVGNRILGMIRGAAKAITTDIPGFLADVADRLAGDTSYLGEKDRSEQMFSAATGTKKKDGTSEFIGSLSNPGNILKAIVVPAFLTKSLKTVKKAEQALNSGTDAAQVEKYTGIFRLPDNIDDGVLRAVIDPSYVNLRPGVTNTAGTELASGVVFRLPEVLDFPQLYQSAPFTRNLMVGHNPAYDPGVASFNSASNYISLGPQRDQMEIIQSILHETQHGVQSKYNMNPGSNPWLFMSDPDQFRDAQKALLSSKQYKEFEVLSNAYGDANSMYKKSAGEAEARAVETMQRGTMQSGRPALSYYGDEYELNRMIRGHEEVRKVDNDPVIQQIIRDALASKKSNP
jgi:hypothetical protein